MIFTQIKNISRISCFSLLVGLVTAGCEKTGLTDDPYGGGKQPLGLTFISKNLEQEVVSAGDVVRVKVKGLDKYKNDFKVFVNEALADVDLAASNDTTLVFKVPIDASTGSMWITTGGQSFFGPLVKVGGKLTVDPTWNSLNGTNGTIFDIELLPSGRYFLGGWFTDFQARATPKVPIGGIVQTLADGPYSTTEAVFGKGVGGGVGVNAVSRINTGAQNGKYILAGNFTSFNSTRPNRQTLSNMVRLNSGGTMDSLILTNIVNPKPEELTKNGDTISAFNGGTDGSIRKAIVLDDKIFVVGNFQNYRRMFIRGSSYDEKVYDVTRMRQIVKMNVDGAMDSTYRFDLTTKQSPFGGNGTILDAIVQTDGKLILVGTFTTFDGKPANHIVRLGVTGVVDDTFKIGSGSDGDIYSIRYNANTQKFTVAGQFNTFNGKASGGVSLLNLDGSNVDTFNSKALVGGTATFAGQLSNGKIIVAGSFTQYGGFMRQGFMVLENTGELAVGYNNTGGFQGTIYDMIENRTSSGTKVVLAGSILRFNATLPGNIMRLNFAN